ncbi:MAG: phosphoribosylglycinamide formyltransferase [Clostridiales bacterium]|jgi:phosphoribosylglycinamide formyltransferase-1|nr:phosphoribosylglycinamide formyltransferase [Clostridiales bacterium]
MLKIGALCSGGGTNLQALIDSEKSGAPFHIAVVISNNPSAFALERARASEIPAFCVRISSFASRDAFEDEIMLRLAEHGVKLVVLAGFIPILGSRFINAYRDRIINIHPSLIPAFCGRGFYGIKVHEAVIASGAGITGATVHFVDEGADTGRIIMQKAVRVQPADTPQTLQKRVMEEAEWILLPEAVRLISEGKARIGGDI